MSILTFIIGFYLGIFVMSLIAVAKSDCTQDCNQGRQCDCAEVKRKYESECV